MTPTAFPSLDHLDLTLGRDRFGHRNPILRLGTGHLAIAGSTDSGKSSWVHSAIAEGARSPYCQVIGVDLKRTELTRWSARLCALARDLREANLLADRVDTFLDQRMALLERWARNTWPATRRHPFILFALDELAEAFKSDRLAEVADRVARLGRAIGFSLISASQQLNAKLLDGTGFRALHTRRATLYDPEAESYRMTLGQDWRRSHGPLVDYLAMDRPGVAVWTDPYISPTPWLCRSTWWRPADIALRADTTARFAIRLPHLLRNLAEDLETGVAAPC